MTLARSITFAVLMTVAAGLALVLPGISSAADSRAATRVCKPPKYPGSGYFLGAIKVRGTTCATGKRFVLAYYRCRVRNGGRKGRCRTQVLGYSCNERRNTTESPPEINATVTCRRGSRSIVHSYQQMLDD